MNFFVVVVLLNFVIVLVKSREFTNEEYVRLPRLFHLDDYDRCLLQKNGVFCVGKFQLYNDLDKPNSLLELIQEYSQDKSHYNRTFIHRGYCLSTRCPTSEQNTTGRFEKCVDQWARTKGLRARLHTLHYCHTNYEVNAPVEIDNPRRIYLCVVFVIVVMNVVGTLYDKFNENKVNNKNNLLISWSMTANWRKFLDCKSRNLKTLEGIRFLCTIIVTLGHTSFAMQTTYHFEARKNEEFLEHVALKMMKGYMNFTQTFFLMSIYITTLNLFKISDKLNLKLLPKLFLMQFVKRWPLYIFAIGFAATWWSDMSSGPMWPIVIESEKNICSRKFWPYAFYVANYFDPGHFCLISSWIFNLEMQFIVVALFLTLAMVKYPNRILHIILTFIAGFYLFAFILHHIIGYTHGLSMIRPESSLEMFVNETSFKYAYIQPVNCAIAFVAGLCLAYMQHLIQTEKLNLNPKLFKWFQEFPVIPLACAVCVGWSYLSIYLFEDAGHLTTFHLMLVERIVYIVSFCLIIFRASNENHKSLRSDIKLKDTYERPDSEVNSKKEKGLCAQKKSKGDIFLSWQGWVYLNRLTYCNSVVHWIFLKAMIAERRTLYYSSFTNLCLDGMGNFIFSLLISLPLTILVQYPLESFLSKIIHKVL